MSEIIRVPYSAFVLPTDPEWCGMTMVRDVLDMKGVAAREGSCGPWALCLGTGWKEHVERPYAPDHVRQSARERTVKLRILEVDGIRDVYVVPWLGEWEAALYQLVVTSREDDFE